MKHNHNHDNVRSAGAQRVPVHFEFTHPAAVSVCVAGTFNHCQPEAEDLHPTRNGRWLKNGHLIRWPEKPCPTRLAGEIRF